MASPLLLAVPVVLSGISSIMGARSASKQNKAAMKINSANNLRALQTNLDNIGTQTAITMLNVKLSQAASKDYSKQVRSVVDQNLETIQATMQYNDLMLQEDEARIWDELGLDMELLHNQRMVERGDIVAAQSASGTVIGEGSNADVVIDSMTQEALDAFVIQRGADYKATDILNARARSHWEGEMEMRKIEWEGEMNIYNNEMQSSMQSLGLIGEQLISSQAQRTSATNQYLSGVSGTQASYANNKSQISNNFMTGLFNTASMAASAYYYAKAPTAANTPVTVTNQPTAAPRVVPYRNAQAYSIATPGVSLMTGS